MTRSRHHLSGCIILGVYPSPPELILTVPIGALALGAHPGAFRVPQALVHPFVAATTTIAVHWKGAVLSERGFCQSILSRLAMMIYSID